MHFWSFSWTFASSTGTPSFSALLCSFKRQSCFLSTHFTLPESHLFLAGAAGVGVTVGVAAPAVGVALRVGVAVGPRGGVAVTVGVSVTVGVAVRVSSGVGVPDDGGRVSSGVGVPDDGGRVASGVGVPDDGGRVSSGVGVPDDGGRVAVGVCTGVVVCAWTIVRPKAITTAMAAATSAMRWL
jgi:hypothetical protein